MGKDEITKEVRREKRPEDCALRFFKVDPAKETEKLSPLG